MAANKELADRMRMQTLATCNNYYYTGQHRKALSILNKMRTMFPGDKITEAILSSICRTALTGVTSEQAEVADFSVLDFIPSDNGLSSVFGENWSGQELSGKILTVFCDQGMGDTIQLMRYLKLIKEKWDCLIYLNCYAYFDEMSSLMECVEYVTFVKEYTETDYHTNIMSIPALLNGLKYECYYPAHFRDLLKKTEIPNEIYLKVDGYGKTIMPHAIGLAWKSNPKNSLGKKKSIPLEMFSSFTKSATLYGLLPDASELLFGGSMRDMLDTANMIQDMDLIISVDTAVLHLAGAMGKPVWGLLPYDADPRWGDEDTTPWYPTMKLYRQIEENNWETVIADVRRDLVEWQTQEC